MPNDNDNRFLIILSYSGWMAAACPDRRKAPRLNDPDLRGRRGEPRAYIQLPASVEALGGIISASLLEVSRTGARLEAADLPGTGRDVVLKCGGLETFGTVVWKISGRCGVQFDEPISVHELMALRDVAEEVERSGMTADEIHAIADWANGLAR